MADNPQKSGIDPAPELAHESVTFETDKLVDLAVSVVVLVTGAFIFAEATTFRTGSFPDPVTSRGLPYFTGAFMMFGAVLTIARRVYTWNTVPGRYALTEGTPDEAGQSASAIRTFVIVALAVGWAALLRPLGFLIVTPPLILAMLWVVNVRAPGKLVVFPLGFTAVIWVSFSQFVGVALPLGPLSALARSWGLMP